MNEKTPSTFHVTVTMEDSSIATDCSYSDVSAFSSNHPRNPNSLLKNVPLTRRRAEYSLLKASYKRIQKGKHPSELVLIGGLSGTGKSMVATSIRNPVTLKRNGFFVSGKFDSLVKEPYSALVEAFSDLCDLVSLDSDTCQKITRALEGDISILSKVIPNLSSVVITKPSEHQSNIEMSLNESTLAAATSLSNAEHPHAQASFTQLKLACRKFLKAAANEKHPVVLFLDDLQWADKASLEIIQAIITDVKSKFLMVIGTYRSDERDAIQDLLDTVKDKETPSLRCTSIQLENFGAPQVTSLIAKCLGMRKSEYLGDLADLVLKRTGGNPHFVIRFVEMLANYNLLEYDDLTGEWLWSVDLIQDETIVTENVVEILKTSIQRLNESVRSVLMLAALQGFKFDRRVIKAATLRQMSAWHADTSKQLLNNIAAQVDEALEVAENEGLIESHRDGTFRFCHDSISDCLYLMTPPGYHLASTHLALARVMQELHDSNAEQDYTYCIAEQLNRSKMLIDTDEDRLECAHCNLRAAKSALTQSAFPLASDFARNGLSVLDIPTKWASQNYSTVLDLHCVAAEAMYCSGNLEESNENLEEVFQHAKSLAAISRARRIHMYSLGAQARFEEAIDVAFGACRELGVKIPRNPNMRNAVWQLIKTKAMLRGKSDEELLAAARLGCGRLEDVAYFLFGAVQYASMSVRVPHLILGVAISMQLTLTGECFTAGSFSNFGILDSVGNISGGIRMASLTFKMYEALNDQVIPPGDVISIHTFMAHWRAPFRDSMEPLRHAYRESLENGSFDVAFLASSTWIQMAMFCGYPLERVESDMRVIFEQMHQFDQKSVAYAVAPYWQLCLNLLGDCDDPAVLSGDAMDEKTYIHDPLAVKVAVSAQVLNVVRVMLACHFDCNHLLKVLISENETYGKLPIGHFMLYITKFYVGLSYIKLYRAFWQRSNKRKANKIAKELRKWARDGCPNTKPLHLLMEAELATLNPRHDMVRAGTLFVDAIHVASETRNDCVEAISNERAARYHQSKAVPDEDLARRHMRRAIDLYRQYGALAKVDFLERTSTLLANTT